jgi:hypothetical protein
LDATRALGRAEALAPVGAGAGAAQDGAQGRAWSSLGGARAGGTRSGRGRSESRRAAAGVDARLGSRLWRASKRGGARERARRGEPAMQGGSAGARTQGAGEGAVVARASARRWSGGEQQGTGSAGTRSG